VTTGKNTAPPIGGVESVQLSNVREIHLESTQQSVLPMAEGRTSDAAEPQPPVRITCDGPLRFDVVRRLATFDDNVLVERLVPEGPKDRLRCDQLAIFLASQHDKPSRSTTPGEPRDPAGSIERVVAIGKPAVLEAPSQSAYTEAERLEYNLKTRQVLLKSFAPDARVRLRRAADEFTAPELAYELVEGKQLGKLWAPGPGALRSVLGAGESRRTFTAQWQREIRIRPQDANQLISLLGAAKIDVQGQGAFSAHELHLWVLELLADRTAQVGLDDPLQSRITPDRLLAVGKVHADSPQLSLDAERLEAWFAQAPVELAPAGRPPGFTPERPQRLILGDPQGLESPPEGAAAPIVERLPRPAGSPLQTPATSDQPPQHFHVVGQVVRMQVKQQGQASSLEQLSVEGEKVRISETNAPQGQAPLILAGKRLDLEGGTGPEAFITVTGEPALVSMRGIGLRSETLKLSRRDNRLTVEQQGSMTLPLTQDLQGQPLEEPEQLQITWQGSMVFDGLTARFRRQVAIRGTSFSAAAEELQAGLSSRIDFSQPKPSDRPPELRRLTMTGGAQLENRTFDPESGRQQTIERMSARELEVDRATGLLHGAGPGWLSRVQVGAPALPGGARPPPDASSVRSGDALSYLRVDFREAMQGHLQQRQVTFSDQVQAVFGPVAHWGDTLEPTSRDELGDRGLVLTADQMQVADVLLPGQAKGTLEMTAVGTTRVEGRDFTARAHRLTYAASKGQLVLEGDGRNEAEIQHQQQNSLSAQKIYYWQDGKIQIEGGKGINLGPAAARPAAPPRGPRDFGQPR
jgi:hypothetical protein